MRNSQRRVLRAVSVAAVAGLALTGCATAAAPVEAGSELTTEDVTLGFSWWGADARTQMTLQAIELFEEEYPNITVEPQFSDWAGYWDRLATTTAGGEMPDVSQFDSLYLASYADRGTLLDLSTVSEVLDLGATPEGLLAAGQVDGTQYALPLGGTPNGVILNKTLFDKYGVELPDFDTWTWDDFTSAAEEISEKSAGEAWGVGPFGADTFGLNIWARQHGENLYDEEGNVAIKPATIVSYWKQATDWIDSGAAPSVDHIAEGTGLPLDQTDLTLGKLGMAFIAAAQVAAYQAAAGPETEFIVGNWPTDSDTVEGFQYLKPTMYWAASAKSEHPAEAALLINFLNTDPDVAEVFGMDRGIPGNPDSQALIEPSLDPVALQLLEFTAAMTEEGGDATPITPNGASDSEAVLSRTFQRVLFGEQKPEEAAKQFISEMQASIDSAK